MSYSIQMPDGSLVENIPDELDPKEAKRQIIAKRPEMGGGNPKSGIMSDFGGAVENLTNLAHTGLGVSLGDANAQALQGIKRQQADAAKRVSGTDTKKIWDKVDQGDYWEAMKEAGRQVPSAMAQIAPSIGQSAGAAAAGRIGGAALGTLVAGPAGTAIGGTLGQYGLPLAVGAVQALGGMSMRKAGEQQEAGQAVDVRPGEMAPYAVASAAVDLLADRFAMPSLFKKVKTPEQMKEASLLLLSKVADAKALQVAARSLGKFEISEVPTEVLQDMLENAAVGAPLADRKALLGYRNTATTTALAGPLGVAGGFHERGQARTQQAYQQGIADVQAQEQAATAQAEKEQTDAAEKQRQLANPEYHQKVAADYAAIEAKRAEMLKLTKVGKNATVAEKLMAAKAKEQLAEFEDTEVTPIAEKYLEVKPFLDAVKAQDDADTAPTPPAAETGQAADGETDMFGPVVAPATPENRTGLDGKTPIQPAPVDNAVPSVNDIRDQKDKLTAEVNYWGKEKDKRQHEMGLKPEDQQATREGIARYREAQEQLERASVALNELPPLPKVTKNAEAVASGDALNEKLLRARKDYTVAVEERDPDKMESALNRINKLKMQQPGLLTKENTSQTQEGDDALARLMAEGRERQAAQTAGAGTAGQTREATRLRLNEALAKRKADEAGMREANRQRPAELDTTQTTQGSMFPEATPPAKQTTVMPPRVTSNDGRRAFHRVLHELSKQSQDLNRSLDAARIRKDWDTVRDLTEQLQAVREAIVAHKQGGELGMAAGFRSQPLQDQSGSELPAMEWGMDTALAERESALLDPQGKLPQQLRTLATAVGNEIETLTGRPMNGPERRSITKQLAAMLKEIDPSGYGGLRNANSAITAIRNSVINQRPGQTVREEQAQAQAQVRDKVTSTPEAAPRETTREDLATVSAPQGAEPLLQRISNNFDALANSRTEGVDDVAELLHKLRTQGALDPTLARDITARLDALDSAKRSETETVKNKRTGEPELKSATQKGLDLEPTKEQVVHGVTQDTTVQGPTQPLLDQGKLATEFKTPGLFMQWLGGEALHKLRLLLTNGTAKQTLSRAKRRIGTLEKTKADLEARIALSRQLEAADKRQGDAAVAAEQRKVELAERQLVDITKRLELELEPFHDELRRVENLWAYGANVSYELSKKIAANSAALGAAFDANYAPLHAAQEALFAARQKDVSKFNWDALRTLQDKLLDATVEWSSKLESVPTPAMQTFARDNLALQQQLTDQNAAIVQLHNQRTEIVEALNEAKQMQSRRVLAKRELPAAKAAIAAAEVTRDRKAAARDATIKRVASQRALLEQKLRDVVQRIQDVYGPKKRAGALPVDRTPAQVALDEGYTETQKQRERLAKIPGERITHEAYRKVLDMVEQGEGRIRELEAHVADETLSRTAHEQWVRKLDRFKALMLATSKLLSGVPEARSAAFLKLDTLVEDAAADLAKAENSSAQDKKKLISEARAEFKKIEKIRAAVAGVSAERTPIGGEGKPTDERNAFEVAQRLLAISTEGTTGKLPPSRQGPVVKNTVSTGLIKTGDPTTAGEVKPSLRNRVTQTGKRKGPTAAQAIEAANRDTERRRIEDTLERVERNAAPVYDKLEAAIDAANEADINKYSAFAARLDDARTRLQAALDAMPPGEEAGSAVREAVEPTIAEPAVPLKDKLVQPGKQQVLTPTHVPTKETTAIHTAKDTEEEKTDATRRKEHEAALHQLDNALGMAQVRLQEAELAEETRKERVAEHPPKTDDEKAEVLKEGKANRAAIWQRNTEIDRIAADIRYQEQQYAKLSAVKGTAVFRTTAQPGAALTVEAVTQFKDKVIKGWTNAPKIEVVAREADLPAHLHAQITEAGVTGKVPGLMDTQTGTVYLVAENLRNGNDIALTIAHEVAGHHGLRSMLGDAYAATMQRLYEGNAAIREIADKRMVNEKGMTRDVAVEEALAEMAETPGAHVSALARVYHAVKQWLAQKLGIKHVSDAEVQQIVANARKHVMEGTPGGGGPTGTKAVFRTAYPEAAKFAASVIAQPTPFKERLRDHAGMRFEMNYVDMRAPIIQALKAASAKTMQNAAYLIRKADARMAHTFAVMSHGALGIRKDAKGLVVIAAGHSKSAKDVFEAIAKVKGASGAERMALAQSYLTARRAARVGWDKLGFDPQRAYTLEQQAKAMMREIEADPAQKAALEHVADVYGDLNRGMITFLGESGYMPKAKAAELLKHNDYVPFYRLKTDGTAILDLGEGHEYPIGNIRNQPYLQVLKGGDQTLLPLNEAIGRNVMMLTDMAMRNLATKDTAYAMQEIGKGKGPPDKRGRPTNKMQIHKGTGPTSGHLLRFNQEPDPKDKNDDGKRYLLLDTEGTAAEGVPTDMLAHSLEGSFATVTGFMKAASWFGDVLRSGVTRNPAYILRQLVRDPLAAAFTGGMDTGVVGSVFASMREYGGQMTGTSKTGAELIRRGMIHSGIFTGDADDIAKIAMQVAGGEQSGYDRFMAVLDNAAMKADGATRATMYDSAIRRGMSEQEAEIASMEMMNFNKRGINPSVQYASRMIPFFNAQIQGLNVLYKAARGQMPLEQQLRIREKFYNRAMLMVGATLVYAAAMDDDETYKNAKARDRYNNWLVPNPLGGEHFRVPIPFEVGILFKMLPEVLMDLMKGKFGEQEWAAVKQAFIQQIPGAGNALVLPQAVKPLIEVAANHSFYTGNTIEPVSKAGLDPNQRFTASTTELAKRFSDLLSDQPIDTLKLSPMQVEHLSRGYLGEIPLVVAKMVNSLFANVDTSKEAPVAPTGKMSDTPFVGKFFQPKEGGGALEAAYAQEKALQQAATTYRAMLKRGDRADAAAYKENVLNVLASPQVAQNFATTMTALKAREAYLRSSIKDPDELEKALDRLAGRKREAAQMLLKAVDAVPH
jgi:hypothetical protein